METIRGNLRTLMEALDWLNLGIGGKQLAQMPAESAKLVVNVKRAYQDYTEELKT